MENDLISRSALVDEIEGYLMVCGSGSVGAVHDVLDAIREAKAVDAIPARHGCWEADVWSYPEKRVIKTVPITEENLRKYAFRKPFDIRLTHERCSVCKEGPLASFNEEYEFSEYCPNCGAKMDAEVEE